MKMKVKNYKKIALALSLCMLILWGVLGAGASLAWFTDTSPEINNIFHFADLDVVVSHRLTDGSWEDLDDKTKVFNEEALYEPGYVQVVYLKVENKGTVPFLFDTAVNVNGCIEAENAFGQRFMLQEHLRFGLVTADTEETMKNQVADRKAAEAIATEPLKNYDPDGSFRLEPKGIKYITLIVRMPQEVNNIANYRGDTVPEVELGVTVRAEQLKK